MHKILMMLLILTFGCLTGCQEAPKEPKLGVSFGVGPAPRWAKERDFMIARANEIGVELLVRFNSTDKPKTQLQDCFELVDSGIDVLIIMPRDVRQLDDILQYAKKKNVKVLSYARAAMSESVSLYVGYDTYKIGQSIAKHMTEKVYKGNYIVIKGDANDLNTSPLYTGVMKYIEPLVKSGDINLLADFYVPKWSPDTCKQILTEVLQANNNEVDAILAPNDVLAAAAREVLTSLNITKPVLISGMDASLDAIKRIVKGEQEMTIYMNLETMANTAIDEAFNLASKKAVNVNSEVSGDGVTKIDAFLVNGQVITKENLDKLLIETGVYTREEVYGE